MICTGQAPWDTSPVSETMTLEVYLRKRHVSSQVQMIERKIILLENVGSDIFACHRVFGNTFLEAAHLMNRILD
jgi:hypothetical protein